MRALVKAEKAERKRLSGQLMIRAEATVIVGARSRSRRRRRGKTMINVPGVGTRESTIDNRPGEGLRFFNRKS